MQWLTVPQAAKQVNSYIERLYRAIAAGELKASNISEGTQRPHWRISEADLDEWMRSKSNVAEPKTNGTAKPKRRKKLPPVKEFV